MMEHALLKVTSFVGVTLGASHYYGSIKYGDRPRIDITYTMSEEDAADFNLMESVSSFGSWFEHKAGEETGRWWSEQDMIVRGIQIFREEFKEERDAGVMLFRGDNLAAPKFCLDGINKTEANNFWYAYDVARQSNDWEEANKWADEWFKLILQTFD